MSWTQILGHDDILQRFRASAACGRLASTYLFVGPPGVGKRTFALKLAQSLLCENSPDDQLDSCGQCRCCQQVAARTHPDLVIVSKPKDKNFIPLELFIGDREHRRQEGLCHDISLTPFHGRRKIAMIDDADLLNAEGANCLLKTLEEPPPHSILILIGTSEQRQLPTIVSRSQIIRFRPLANQDVLKIISTGDLFETELSLEKIAAASGGSVQTAIKLSSADYFEFRQQLFNQLATLDPGQNGFAKTLGEFVDSTSKDAAERRATLTDMGDMSIDFFRQCIQRAISGGNNEDPFADAIMIESVDRAIENFNLDADWIAEIAADAIDRTQSNAVPGLCQRQRRQRHPRLAQ